MQFSVAFIFVQNPETMELVGVQRSRYRLESVNHLIKLFPCWLLVLAECYDPRNVFVTAGNAVNYLDRGVPGWTAFQHFRCHGSWCARVVMIA